VTLFSSDFVCEVVRLFLELDVVAVVLAVRFVARCFRFVFCCCFGVGACACVVVVQLILAAVLAQLVLVFFRDVVLSFYVRVLCCLLVVCAVQFPPLDRAMGSAQS